MQALEKPWLVQVGVKMQVLACRAHTWHLCPQNPECTDIDGELCRVPIATVVLGTAAETRRQEHAQQRGTALGLRLKCRLSHLLLSAVLEALYHKEKTLH